MLKPLNVYEFWIKYPYIDFCINSSLFYVFGQIFWIRKTLFLTGPRLILSYKANQQGKTMNNEPLQNKNQSNPG